MNYEEEMCLVRKEMKSLIIKFNHIVRFKSKMPLDPQEKEKIHNELYITANKFAKKYNNLQLKYMDLLFFSDLSEISGKDNANLFLKFNMAQNSKNN
ncbi:hypothetical protein ES705_48129 [subsurface metagenome]